MNLSKLFEIQKALDERIMDEHPELKGQDNLAWKVLALQVELGECANEWRGFKKWSHDQVPRVRVMKPDTWENLGCPTTEEELNAIDDKCWRNPLLEEYVDCLSFVLTIGLELELREEIKLRYSRVSRDITHHFSETFLSISDFIVSTNLGREATKAQYEDMLANFIILGKLLGFTWDQIEQAYLEKNKENHERQNNGY